MHDSYRCVNKKIGATPIASTISPSHLRTGCLKVCSKVVFIGSKAVKFVVLSPHLSPSHRNEYRPLGVKRKQILAPCDTTPSRCCRRDPHLHLCTQVYGCTVIKRRVRVHTLERIGHADTEKADMQHLRGRHPMCRCQPRSQYGCTVHHVAMAMKARAYPQTS